MRKSKLRKGLVLAVIVLFVGASVLPSISGTTKNLNDLSSTQSIVTQNRGVLYVGGDGPGNYSTIQDAIDDANSGDTIIVYSGNYTENVDVDKQLTMNGLDDGGGKPVVDAMFSGSSITLNSDEIDLDEFKVINSGYDTGGIKINSNGNTISNNTILNNYYGIHLWGSNNLIIKNNISTNTRGGIYGVSGYANTIISENNISSNYIGIEIHGTNYNIIGNTICSNYGKHGIFLFTSSNNVISNNTICSNSQSGIYFRQSSNNNVISENMITNNDYGMYLKESSNKNNIIRNDILDNNYYGLRFNYATSNFVYLNNIADDLLHEGSINTFNSTELISYFYKDALHTNYMGNQWEDYSGNDTDGNGIGDTPYKIDDDNLDYYPLIQPWEYYFPSFDLIYVDDDFNSSTLGWNTTHFDNIHDGIDAVNENGTVFVFNGTYSENVVVDKTVNLYGENRNNTIIDGAGSGDVVYISADSVNISGFTIQNSGNSWGDACINIVSNDNTISENIIINNDAGLFGIYLHEISNDNAISGNVISECTEDGIYLRDSSSNNTISENTILNNHDGIQLYEVSNNNLFNNTILNNIDDGIGLGGSSNNNNIFMNTFDNNDDVGVAIGGSSNNNIMYHNNFINNTQNAYDEGSNTWYNATIQEGNYWDEYNGTDADGDGIGDTPYNISGGDNQDNYPLMTPYGPPYAEFNYTTDDRTVLFNASLSYDYNGNITSYKWDFGDGNNGTGMIVNHTYNDYGTYNVMLTVTDDDSLKDNVSKDITIVDETPPEISNVQAIPPIQLPGGYVNISAMVTDNDELDDVCVVIEYPDNYVENISILQNKTGDTYYCNRTYEITGTYTYHIWAIDDGDNGATSSLYLFIITEEFIADAGGPYYGWVGVPLQFNGYAVGGEPPYSWHWDFGDGNTSDIQNPVHTYTIANNYTVKLTVTDDESNIISDTTWALIEVLNEPPGAPIINGQANGKTGVEYEYTFNSTDPDDDPVMYLIDWGDNNTDWTEYCDSGDEIMLKHTWDEQGDFTIKAKAKDIFDAESEWGTLEVTMPKNKPFFYNSPLLNWLVERFPLLQRLLIALEVYVV